MNQKQEKADELFFVVDAENQPLDPLPRKQVHGFGVWHRVAHIWIIRSDGMILCQQRSLSKENNPGYWEGFFGGHMQPGESYEAAAGRELREELGITVPEDALKLWKVYHYADPDGKNNEFQAIFTISWDGDIAILCFEDGEVAQVAWKGPDEIREGLSDGDAPWTNLGYELDLLKDIKARNPVRA